jgi:hypothetical protein
MKFVFFSSLKPYPQKLVRKALKEKVVGQSNHYKGKKYYVMVVTEDLHSKVIIRIPGHLPMQVIFTEGKAIKERAS